MADADRRGRAMQFMILGAMLAGGFVAARSGLDARLGKELPVPALAAIASGVVAAITVLLYVLATRASLPSASQIAAIPAWCWAGGIAGGGGLVLVILLTPRLGIATVSAWVTAGQMVFSLAADQWGWFGLDPTPISWLRAAGAAVVTAGAFIILKG